MKKGFIIAIDGPVAAGKGTIAPILSQKVKGFYFYTGAMYRCLALLCLRHKVDVKNDEQVISLLPHLQMSFKQNKIFLNDEDITDMIKNHDIAQAASITAGMPKVRKVLGKKQREIGLEHAKKGEVVVTEGRDQGTAIFPDVDLKIFLTARPEIRAKRRLLQLQEMGDNSRKFDTLLQEIKQRDKQDQERETDPLVKEPEKFAYFTVDDSDMTKEETIKVITQELKRRKLVP